MSTRRYVHCVLFNCMVTCACVLCLVCLLFSGIVCMCVYGIQATGVLGEPLSQRPSFNHTHTRTHTRFVCKPTQTSNLVFQADRSLIDSARNEATGEVETLFGKMGGMKMGDRARRAGPSNVKARMEKKSQKERKSLGLQGSLLEVCML